MQFPVVSVLVKATFAFKVELHLEDTHCVLQSYDNSDAIVR